MSNVVEMPTDDPPSKWTNHRVSQELQRAMDLLLEPDNEYERIQYRKLIRVMAVARNRLRNTDAPEEPTPSTPDGYAVVQASGYFVGIWKDRETAEGIAAKQPARDGERVVPMKFLQEPTP